MNCGINLTVVVVGNFTNIDKADLFSLLYSDVVQNRHTKTCVPKHCKTKTIVSGARWWSKYAFSTLMHDPLCMKLTLRHTDKTYVSQSKLNVMNGVCWKTMCLMHGGGHNICTHVTSVQLTFRHAEM